MIRVQLAALFPLALAAFAALGAGLAVGVVSADEWARKMMDRLGVAGGDWEKGMQGASGKIVSRARGAAKKWAANVQAAIAGGHFEKGLGRVTDEDIIRGALAAGGGKLVAGVTQRRDKVAKAIGALQPEVAALESQIAAMPNGTEAEAEARALAAIRGMRAIGRKLSGLSR